MYSYLVTSSGMRDGSIMRKLVSCTLANRFIKPDETQVGLEVPIILFYLTISLKSNKLS